jgi:hypothetical protein
VRVSILEISRENVNDLFIPPPIRDSGCKVREHKTLSPYVEGLTHYSVHTYE